jgi:hypothetical protein
MLQTGFRIRVFCEKFLFRYLRVCFAWLVTFPAHEIGEAFMVGHSGKWCSGTISAGRRPRSCAWPFGPACPSWPTDTRQCGRKAISRTLIRSPKTARNLRPQWPMPGKGLSDENQAMGSLEKTSTGFRERPLFCDYQRSRAPR